jgi:hypothetical protein
MKDYLRRGLLGSLPRHVMTGIALFLFSVVGKRSPVAAVCICSFREIDDSDSIQWRYLLFIGLFALELYLIVAPTPWMLFPQRVAYQHILLLHEVFLFLSVAVSRVAPVLFAGEGDGDVRAVGARMGELARGIERECECAVACHVRADGWQCG